ncbi:class I SAM-dependent methyltransferase [Kiritimatiellota bacterium B12222]|nr:class I SAM-dependent methyltransferase [Kiritimatiellota bacterium B12222]
MTEISHKIDYTQFKTHAVPCCVCGSEKHEFFCTKDGMDYVTCCQCSHVYIRNQVSETDLLSIYSSRKSHHNLNDKLKWDFSRMKAKLYYDKLLKRIGKYVDQGPLLDIGCSNGSFARAALDGGWDALGLELEESSVATAKAHGVKVIQGELHSQSFPDNHFHAVTMWNLFEHLSEPNATLKEIYRILKPGGVCAMCVPNIRSIGWWMLGPDWHSVEPQIHLNLFSTKTLSLLVRSNGFHVRHQVTLDIKPATISAWIKGKSSRKTSNHAASVAGLAQKSPAKMRLLFGLRQITNPPLILTHSGEDIFCTIQKPKDKTKRNPFDKKLRCSRLVM